MYGYDREKSHVNHLWELKSLKKKSVVKGGVGGGEERGHSLNCISSRHGM